MTTLPFPSPPITVVLAGNPNCGKTTLFNQLTGSRQRVGNFSGVTVARKEGTVTHHGRMIRVIDLPGIYSLSSQTMEEIVSRDVLLDEQPDLIINVLDAGNLERNLFLTTQLIEMGGPRLYCLNMIDEARAKGVAIDTAAFATLLDGPVVETVGRTGEGITRLLDQVLASAQEPPGRREIRIPYDEHLEAAIKRLREPLLAHVGGSRAKARWLAIKLLEGDQGIVEQHRAPDPVQRQAREERRQLAEIHGMEGELLLADGRYGFIRGLLEETTTTGKPVSRDLTRRVDDLLMHRLWGLPIFFLFMWVMFQSTFTLGQYPADWIDGGVVATGEWVEGLLPEGWGRDLLVEGVMGGIGSVLVFLPNIVLLFLFIAFFEDTGYMARVAFLMDRFMHVVGLHGKAFIPLLMGFGCNVPAIMATRTMESPRDRLLAILINPFMSCSARLPVYILFGAAFFAEWAGSLVFLLYLLGIAVSLAGAFLLKRTLFRGISDPFVMELPPYRLPTLRSVLTHMWDRAVQFLRKVGKVILAGSMIIWFLQAFPREVPLSQDYPARIAVLEQSAPEEAAAWRRVMAAEEQEGRYLGRLGHFIQPVFAPLGFDWKASIALLTGFVAKEVVVSTLGVLHHVGEEADEASQALHRSLQKSMDPVTAFAFLVFTLLYVPCLSTIAVIRRETGSWGWTGFSVFFSLGTAWVMAWLVVWLGR